MIIHARDMWGRSHAVDVSSDQKLVVAMLFVPALLIIADVSDGWQGVLLRAAGQFAGIAGIFALFEVLGLLQLIWLLLRGFRFAPLEVDRLVRSMCHHEGLPPLRRLRILWRPTDFSVNARVNGAPLLRILAVTGGLVAAATADPVRARPVLMHERAHVENADFLVYAMMAMLFSGLGMGCRGIIEIAKFPFVVYLLRRRELLADAFAMQFAVAPTQYGELLGARAMRHGLLRPSHAERLRAATADNLVLRTSHGLVAISRVLVLTVALHFVIIWFQLDRYHGLALIWFPVLGVVATILCARPARVEEEKGDAPKISQYGAV